MTFEDSLKKEIIAKHGSVLAFSKSSSIPNSTIDSILTRGIYKSGVGTVMQIFEALAIDPESLSVGRIIYTWEKEKNPPAPAEPEQGEERITIKNAEDVLVALGYIQPGEDLTEADSKIIHSVLDILDTWFQEKG